MSPVRALAERSWRISCVLAFAGCAAAGVAASLRPAEEVALQGGDALANSVSPSGTPERSPGTAPSLQRKPILLLESAKDPAALFDRSGAKSKEIWPEPSGLARRDRNYAMVLDRGAFTLEGAGRHVAAEAGAAGELSIEMFLTAGGTGAAGRTPVLTIASAEGPPCLELALEGDGLFVSLRGDGAASKAGRLCSVPTARGSHLVVSFRDGLVVCCLDGTRVLRSERSGVRLADWRGTDIVLGGAGGPGPVVIAERVALHARFFDEEDARAGYERCAAALAARPSPERLEVVARLLERSSVPEAKDIAPYTRALVVYEYRVEEVLSGSCPARAIRVAHWGLLDSSPLPIREAPVGTRLRLRLERFDENPQLESEWLSDTLRPDTDAPLYYDIDVWSGQGAP